MVSAAITSRIRQSLVLAADQNGHSDVRKARRCISGDALTYWAKDLYPISVKNGRGVSRQRTVDCPITSWPTLLLVFPKLAAARNVEGGRQSRIVRYIPD